MVKLKSAIMMYKDNEIEMKQVNSDSCVQLYFEILGNKFELDYFDVYTQEITKQMDLEYNYENNVYILKNYEYKLTFEINVDIEGVTNVEELVIVTKNEDGVLNCEYNLLDTAVSNKDISEGVHELYKLLEPNVYMKICGACMHGNVNPEGGDQMYNYLCVLKKEEKFTNDNETIEKVCILDNCNNFKK